MASLTNIPVADALHPTPARAAGRSPVSDAAPNSPRNPLSNFYVLILGMVLFSFLGLFTQAPDWRVMLAVYARYLLWTLIVVGIGLHLGRHGKDRLLTNIAIVMPFFLIGIVAGIFGTDIVMSARLLVFWLLGILAAAVIGEEVDPGTLQRALFWYFFVILIGTILLVIVDPKLAVGTDTRGVFGTGSWSGPFPGKNMLGWVASYALIFGLFTKGVSKGARVTMLIATAICAVCSGSQGGVICGLGAVGFVVVVAMLRRMPLSPGARGATLATLSLVVLPILFVLSGYVLEMLGRDATLTGRTGIWQAFLGRALTFWPIGAGPGSFTTDSAVTSDLSFAFEGLGEIHTPHNIFIATLGETGVFGLLAMVLALSYVAFVLPFRSPATSSLPTSAVAFSMMLGGMIETREVFGPAIGMFLIVLMLTVTRKETALIRIGGIMPLGTPEKAPVPVARPGIPVLGR